MPMNIQVVRDGAPVEINYCYDNIAMIWTHCNREGNDLFKTGEAVVQESMRYLNDDTTEAFTLLKGDVVKMWRD